MKSKVRRVLRDLARAELEELLLDAYDWQLLDHGDRLNDENRLKMLEEQVRKLRELQRAKA